MNPADKRTNAPGIDIESFRAPQLGIEDHPGVGARQQVGQIPREGGGYQGACTGSNFETEKSPPTSDPAISDRRFAELVAMSLNPVWLSVAREIGVDNFLAMWRIVDGHPPHWHDDGSLRLRLRRYSAYCRFQRNRYIEALHRLSVPITEIRRRVEVAFGDRLGDRQLQKFRGKVR